MITADVFRRVRLRVMRQKLEPHGFQRGRDNVYWRESPSSQIHSIKFATGGRFRNFFAVELGFHYSFVPPFDEWRPPAFFEKERYSPYKCCFQMRLRKVDNDQFYDYGETQIEAEELLGGILTRVLSIFSETEQKWSDGESLLAALNPSAIEEEHCLFADNTKTNEHYSRSRIRKLFPDWDPLPSLSEVCTLLAYIALRFGGVGDAKEYHRIAEVSIYDMHSPMLVELERNVDKAIRQDCGLKPTEGGADN